ncbi:MAG: polyphosphate polymerase domain-containing protein [Alphaproteobacteria bacterium]
MISGTYGNRFEIKYVVDTRRLPEIEAGLSDFLEPDPNGNGGQGYYVHSIYFDSPDYRFYTDKIEGELIRVKPRIRCYRSAPNAPPRELFLELKGRFDRVVAKRRTPIDIALANRLLETPAPELNGAAVMPSALAEFNYLCQRYRLSPSVTVLYHRMPFHGAFYPNMRMTIDRAIQCSLSTRLDSPADAFGYALPPDQAIIELKYNEKVSGLLLRRLRSLNLRQQTISKYAISLETCYRQVYRGRVPV